MALTRDVPFSQYGTDDLTVTAAGSYTVFESVQKQPDFRVVQLAEAHALLKPGATPAPHEYSISPSLTNAHCR